MGKPSPDATQMRQRALMKACQRIILFAKCTSISSLCLLLLLLPNVPCYVILPCLLVTTLRLYSKAILTTFPTSLVKMFPDPEFYLSPHRSSLFDTQIRNMNPRLLLMNICNSRCRISTYLFKVHSNIVLPSTPRPS